METPPTTTDGHYTGSRSPKTRLWKHPSIAHSGDGLQQWTSRQEYILYVAEPQQRYLRFTAGPPVSDAYEYVRVRSDYEYKELGGSGSSKLYWHWHWQWHFPVLPLLLLLVVNTNGRTVVVLA